MIQDILAGMPKATAMMTQARTALVLRHPFYGFVALHLEMCLDVQGTVTRTMGTDGHYLFYHAEFVEALSIDLIAGVIAHEIHHVIWKHPLRVTWRDLRLWNHACDYVINGELLETGFSLPGSRLFDERFTGMSADAVYNLLADELQQSAQEDDAADESADTDDDTQTGGGANDDDAIDNDDDDGPVNSCNHNGADCGEARGDGTTAPPGDVGAMPGSAQDGEGPTDDEGSKGGARAGGSQGGQPTEGTGSCSGENRAPGAPGVSNGAPGSPRSRGDVELPEIPDGVAPQGGTQPGYGGCGSFFAPRSKATGKGLSAAERIECEANVNLVACQAAAYAKAVGNLPAWAGRFVEEFRKSETDWREVLRRFVQASLPMDYGWIPPNPRYVWRGMYLPAVQKQGTGEIALIIDTSGSIGKDELEQFAGELRAICDTCSPTVVHVIYVDAEVAHKQSFRTGEFVEVDQFEPRGGGGTAFAPAFRFIEEEALPVQCAIYLTDLYGQDFGDAPPYPVLWASTVDHWQTNTGYGDVPFGDTLTIKVGSTET